MLLLLRIAWRNLIRSWHRSLIVVSGVTVGLSGCLVVIAWSGGLFRGMTDGAIRTWLAHVAVHARGYHASPDLARSLAGDGLDIVRALSEEEGVHVAPRLRSEGLVQSARRSVRSVITGIVPERERHVSIVAEAIVAGDYFAARARPRALPPVVIGSEMAERLRVGIGDKVVLRVPGEAGLGAYRVRGIYRTASATFDRIAAFVRLADAQQLLETGQRVTEVAVRLDDESEISAFRTRASQRLEEAPLGVDLEVLTWEEREPRLATMIDMMADLSWILYAVVFVAAAFGIANALLMAVYERIREFGVLRSLGLKPRSVVLVVALESILLSLGGTALGLGLGVGAVLWLGEVGIDLSVFSDVLAELGVGSRLYPTITRTDLIIPIVLAAATALMAAIWPALKAARLLPAEALRHV
jgi:ABC-type lipoprotein release transport system permease subunit